MNLIKHLHRVLELASVVAWQVEVLRPAARARVVHGERLLPINDRGRLSHHVLLGLRLAGPVQDRVVEHASSASARLLTVGFLSTGMLIRVRRRLPAIHR